MTEVGNLRPSSRWCIANKAYILSVDVKRVVCSYMERKHHIVQGLKISTLHTHCHGKRINNCAIRSQIMT